MPWELGVEVIATAKKITKGLCWEMIFGSWSPGRRNGSKAKSTTTASSSSVGSSGKNNPLLPRRRSNEESSSTGAVNNGSRRSTHHSHSHPNCSSAVLDRTTSARRAIDPLQESESKSKSCHTSSSGSGSRRGRLKLDQDEDRASNMKSTSGHDHHHHHHSHKTRRRHTTRPRTKKAPRFKYSFLVKCLGVHRPDPTQKMMQYEIIDVNALAFPRLRVEWREDNVCPFCRFPCTSSDKVIKHLHRFHRDHHSCQVSDEADGIIQITATPIRAYRDQAKSEVCRPLPREPECKFDDFVFVRYRNHDHHSSIMNGAAAASSSTSRKRKRRRRLPVQPWLPEGWDARQNSSQGHGEMLFPDPWTVPLHLRSTKEAIKARDNPRLQYYHTRSRLPMRVGDWEVDSEEESDNEWVDLWSSGGIKAFTDVNDNEKLLLVLWNRFTRADVLIDEKTASERILAFIKQHGHELNNASARKQLLMFLTMFTEHRMISSSRLLDCMNFYDQVVKGNVPSAAGKAGYPSKRFKPAEEAASDPDEDG